MKKRDLPVNVLKYAILILILFFLLFPLYWVLVTSFKTNMEAYMATPTFFPASPTFQSYVNLFTKNNDFFTYNRNKNSRKYWVFRLKCRYSVGINRDVYTFIASFDCHKRPLFQ